MASLLKWAKTALRRAPSNVSCFPTRSFKTISTSQILEEDRFEEFRKEHCYPVNIGDIFSSKYQITGKLGFGLTSTVWLARDLEGHHDVTSKMYTRDEGGQDEFRIYKHLNQGNPSHPGYAHVGEFQGFVASESETLIYWRSSQGWSYAGFLALDYLHTECGLVHADIKSASILLDIEDTSILDTFAKAEMEHPSPRKFINYKPVHASRRFDLSRVFGKAVLSDFGSAVRGDERRNHDAQPNVYRAPEVMLKTEWSYPVDIWNVGVMVWDLFEGKHMFYGNDPDGKGYSTHAHLAEVVGMFGLPPLDLLKSGKRSHEFFDEDGHWRNDIEIPEDLSLAQSEENLSGRNKEMFLGFMRGMLQWRPEDRKTAKELL